MTPVLRIILVAVAVLLAFYILQKIRKAKLLIEDSIFWLGITVILLVFSIFPAVPEFFARLLGVQATYNFLYLFFIFLLLLKMFLMSLKASQQDRKLTELVQEIAIRDKKLEELYKEGGDSPAPREEDKP